jgi:hypothetical protein
MRRLSKAGLSAAIVATILAGPALAEQRQFNLECEFVVQHAFWIKDEQATQKRVYRVDLDTKMYCVDDCPVVTSLFALSPTTIVFSEEGGHWEEVDRTTGVGGRFQPAYPGTEPDYKGTCTSVPFTGFPSTKF